MTALFSPLDIGPLTLANRIVVAPMCQYSAVDGLPQPFHVQHLGRLALSGAGLLIIEATAVTPDGRISWADLGLWSEAHELALSRLVADIRTYSSIPIGIQLGHAGRKASTNPPWIERGGPAPPSRAWVTVSASNKPFADTWPAPRALDEDGLRHVIESFAAAARRADRAGFDVLELHAAHGYLLSQFLSPLVNQRDDRFGGSLENRMRFPLMVADAVRNAWPIRKALGVRFNGTDWLDGGISVEEAALFGQCMHEAGFDYLHVSSGGNDPNVRIPGATPGYQVSLAETVKRKSPEAKVLAVGMIVDPHHAQDIVQSGAADAVGIGRAMLDDVNWPHHAAMTLGGVAGLPPQYARVASNAWPGYDAARLAGTHLSSGSIATSEGLERDRGDH